MWLSETAATIGGIVLMLLFGYGYITKKRKHAAWRRRREWLLTQPPAVRAAFTDDPEPDLSWRGVLDIPEPSPEVSARQKRRSNVLVGLEIIVFGLAIPIGYAMLEVMFMSDTTTLEWVLVGAASSLCIIVGIVVIVRRNH